jgi:lipoprotein signal peptidase
VKKNLFTYVKTWYIQLLFWSLLLDFITKQWAASTQVNQVVIDGFFYLSYSRNTGAAWSILS